MPGQWSPEWDRKKTYTELSTSFYIEATKSGKGVCKQSHKLDHILHNLLKKKKRSSSGLGIKI